MDFVENTVLEPPSEKSIKKFEENYKVKLPLVYLNTLMIGNGGVPIKRQFYEENRKRFIERMLCILNNPAKDDKSGWYDIGVVITQIEERLVDNPDIIGINVIPIAAIFGGDFLCLDYRENEDSPNVSVWEHEESDIFRPYLVKVANSFEEFETLLTV